MGKPSKEIVFLGGKRTPFGTYCGALKGHSATDLAVIASKAALAQAGVSGEDVDHVIFGNVMQSSPDAIYLARHAGLKAGVPQERGAVTINRLCGSGFQSVVDAARMIATDEASIVLAGGSESMTQTPHTVRGIRTGVGLFSKPMADYIEECLFDTYAGAPMAITAENLGAKFEVSRADADAFALLSQQRWGAAQEAGRFADELCPVELVSRKGTTLFEADEHPRPATTLEGLQKLKPVFKKEGLVTAGNASGICDGGAAMVLASAEAAAARGLKPLARLVSWGVVGCDPSIMGIGPVPAAKAALESAGMTLDQMDLVEVNEAFAPQYLAVERALGLDREKTNVNGGAIALGHPLAASGTRITMTLIYELRRRGLRYGLGSACIGGGQGIAVIVEAL
jgi:acetyl-CoA acetyltransferase family protein